MMLITRHCTAVSLTARRKLLSAIATLSHSVVFLSASASASFLPQHRDDYPASVQIADIALEFKQWFGSRETILLDRVYEVLDSEDNPDAILSRLHLPLNENFVVRLLNHRRPSKDVLSCLKFFDWAAHQTGFRHTQATFHAIFKILSKAKLTSVMLDWLHSFSANHHMYRLRLHDTLVMGYALAGKVDLALQLLGKMRFQGLELDTFAYNVLLNSLVENSRFRAADSLLEQISLRGLEDPVTRCIRVKSLSTQRRLEEAKNYVLELDESGHEIPDHMVNILVDAFCNQGRLEEARNFLQAVEKSANLSQTFRLLIIDLIDSQKVNDNMTLLKAKKLEVCVPEVISYNKLICWLLKKQKLEAVYDLLVEMKENGISPDSLTMNAVLSFFCKAGMIDVAKELYNLRLEVGLPVSSLTYNQFINALCRDDNLDEACKVLEDSLNQGYFPSKKTFYILADRLCADGKLDIMGKLVDVALQKKITLNKDICLKYVSALCEAGRAECGYLISRVLNGTGFSFDRKTLYSLITGLTILKRGDLASELLVEHRSNGLLSSRSMYQNVIRCFCENGKFREISELLEKQLTGYGSLDRRIYHYFIDGVGHAGRPELAEEVFTRMVVKGITPTVRTKILILRSFISSRCVVGALNYFQKFAQEDRAPTRLYNTMIRGLCEAGLVGEALQFWKEMRANALVPSLESYEMIVQLLCSSQEYEMAVSVLKDLDQTGRPVSPFICNVLILQSLKDPKFRLAWSQFPWESSRLKLELLVRAFSGGIRLKGLHSYDKIIEMMEAMYPVDLYTHNLLLRGLNMSGRWDHARELFDKLREKGFTPNRYTYDCMLHGLCKQGKRREAKILKDEMELKGFFPTESTRDLYGVMIKQG